jgi:hypothetical protein
MNDAEKLRENRLRRTAQRQELRLIKSKRRDPYANDYGVYWLTDAHTSLLLTNQFGLDLDEVEEWLTANKDARESNDHDHDDGDH